jgi:hypothetical protein
MHEMKVVEAAVSAAELLKVEAAAACSRRLSEFRISDFLQKATKLTKRVNARFSKTFASFVIFCSNFCQVLQRFCSYLCPLISDFRPKIDIFTGSLGAM